MSENREHDVIASICEGRGTRFKGACRYYDRFRRECVLLREQRMEEFWDSEQGRCAYIVLTIAEDGCMKTFKMIYPGLAVNDDSDLVDYDVQAVIERLKTARLKEGYTLPVWHGYVSRTLYQEIGKKLGVILERKECGTCKHLSQSKAYICVKKGEILKNLNDVCGEYRPKQTASEKPGKQECTTCEDLSRKSYFCYQKREPRNRTDGTCKEEYRQDFPGNFDSIDPDPQADDNESTRNIDQLLYRIHQALGSCRETPEELLIRKEKQERRSFDFIQNLLNDRVEEELLGSKKRKIYERQYEVWINMWHSIAEIPREELIKTLAREHNVTEKTIRCDLEEIREFLREKNVFDD